jgi:hypothetical protein
VQNESELRKLDVHAERALKNFLAHTQQALKSKNFLKIFNYLKKSKSRKILNIVLPT